MTVRKMWGLCPLLLNQSGLWDCLEKKKIAEATPCQYLGMALRDQKVLLTARSLATIL
jgi:hypothetical protein